MKQITDALAEHLQLADLTKQYSAVASMKDIADQYRAVTSIGDIAKQYSAVASMKDIADQYKAAALASDALKNLGVRDSFSSESSIGSIAEQLKDLISIGGVEDRFKVTTSLGAIIEQFRVLNAASVELSNNTALAGVVSRNWLSAVQVVSDLAVTSTHFRERVDFPPRAIDDHVVENRLPQHRGTAERTESTGREGQRNAEIDINAVIRLVENLVGSVLVANDPQVKNVFWERVYPLILLLVSLALAPVADHYIKLGLATLANQPRKTDIKQVKNAVLNSGLPREMLREHRYVDCKTKIVVRLTPRKNAQRIGEIPKAAVVQIIQANENWSLVRWASEEESSLVQGWVFSRYLKKFK